MSRLQRLLKGPLDRRRRFRYGADESAGLRGIPGRAKSFGTVVSRRESISDVSDSIWPTMGKMLRR